jgi:hypothetical protein
MPFEKGKSYYRLKEITWDVDKNGCWNCTSHSPSNGGYPRHKVNYKGKRISHTMFEKYNGPIPEGMIVCHKCDNKMCVNSDHLFIGTQADNMKDMCNKGRKFITKGELDGMAKLTESQVLEIRQIKEKRGLSHAKIAEMFNTSTSNIGLIVQGKRWKHSITEGQNNV